MAAPDTDPTPAQIEAGNYRKGHIKYQGLDITIENLKGSKRRGVDSKGKSWESTLPADYGYIKRTVGADKDQLDVYVGPNKDAFMVWVVNQKDLDTDKFDEHKCMLGFKTKKEAIEIYVKGFNDGKGLRRIISVKSMTVPKFKEWIKEKDNMTKEAQARLERRVYLKGYFDKVAQYKPTTDQILQTTPMEALGLPPQQYSSVTNTIGNYLKARNDADNLQDFQYNIGLPEAAIGSLQSTPEYRNFRDGLRGLHYSERGTNYLGKTKGIGTTDPRTGISTNPGPYKPGVPPFAVVDPVNTNSFNRLSRDIDRANKATTNYSNLLEQVRGRIPNK